MIRALHVRDKLPRRGKRYLVERLWPKGVNREELGLAAWCKEAAPTHDLLRWYGNKLERWMEFRDEYRKQLEDSPRAWRPLLEFADGHDIVLLHAARDRDHNHAEILREFLEEHIDG